MTTKTEAGFLAWYKKVDRLLVAKWLLGVDDLPDCPYRDWYEDGVTPARAAARAIKLAQE